MYKLGIDIGGTKVKIGILADNNVIASKKIYVGDIGKVDFFGNIAKEALSFINSEKIDTSKIEFCGVGVPGTVDAKNRIAVKLPNLGIYNVNGAKIIEKMLHIPTALVQDSRAAAWAEYCVGVGKSYNTILCLTLGTGIGTGIVIDGKIFDGGLGFAGEIGHNVVVKNGRECKCGSSGCLGMYSAGLGLDMTARELLGDDASAPDLFKAAEQGSADAKAQIDNAIALLGDEIVAMCNLISPDCVVFSGGISRQKELYVNPLIKYVKGKIYSADGQNHTYFGISKLGEDSPMIGAALIPHHMVSRNVKLSASIMCADIMNLARDFEMLEQAGIDLFHMDIMDEHFVPNMMLPVDFINRMRSETKIPFDIHIMAETPEKIIDDLCLKNNDIVSIHYESTNHVQRVLQLIKEKGAKAAIAINPATPMECVTEVLCDVDMILVMTVNPGFAGQKLIRQCLEKVRKIREYLDNNGHKNIDIEVDGNCSFENIPLMKNCGANIFVLGTSSLFRDDISIKDAVVKIHKSIDDEENVNE